MILPPILAFLSGLLLGSFFPFFPCSIVFLLFLVGLGLTWLEWAGRINRRHGLLCFGGLVVGIVYWTAAMWVQDQSDLLKWMRPQPVKVRGVVDEPVRRGPDRMVIIIDVSQIVDRDTPYTSSGRVRLTWRDPDQAVFQGSHIEVMTTLRAPYGTLNPGGFDYGMYLERQGIQAVASVSGPGQVEVFEPESIDLLSVPWNQIDQWREQVQKAAQATLRGSALGLYLGMVIGEQRFISQEMRVPFMATGTVHIISISGSHLGLIAFLIFFVVKGIVLRLPSPWLEGLSRYLTATRLAVLLTLPCVTFYTLLAGAETPTVRSLVMIVFYLLAVWLGRERNILTALALAAMLVLLHNPQALYDSSFQLSYMSVLAIALIIQGGIGTTHQNGDTKTSKHSSVLSEGGQWIKQAMGLTIAVTLATLPLVAYYFNQIPWLGVLSNLLVVPFVGFVVVPLGLTSAVWVLVTGAESLPLVWLNQAVLDALAQMVVLLARIPGAEWHVASPAIFTMGLFYALVVMALWGFRQSGLRLGCAIGVVVILLWWAWSPRLGVDGNTLRVTFLDVGQGDATVIELPDGQTVLVDGGPTYATLDMGRAVIGPFLWDQGIRRVDHVIATHPQWDHIGGLAWLVKTFDVGRYWSNGVTRNKPFYFRVRNAIQEAGIQENMAWKGQEIIKAGPCSLTVLNPPPILGVNGGRQATFHSGSALNNQSVITQLDCGQHSFLFTADAERKALQRLNQEPGAHTARVVKVPHHGAKSSLYRPWINQLKAEAAIISVGKRNRFGHPVSAVLHAYDQKGIPMYRTDKDGAVWITAKLSSSDLVIQTAKDLVLHPVRLDASVLEQEAHNWTRLCSQWLGVI